MNIHIEYKQVGYTTYIAKVFGGWLVKEEDNRNSQYGRQTGNYPETPPIAIVFIPDPNYQWEKEALMTKTLTGKRYEIE